MDIHLLLEKKLWNIVSVVQNPFNNYVLT
jgi:hypothetical protein